MTTSVFNFEGEVSLERIEKIRNLLIAQPRTQADVSRALGSAKATIYAFFKHLKANDRIHITGWNKGQNRMTALWAWGPGINEPAPEFVKKPKWRKEKPAVEEVPAIIHAPRFFKPQPVFRDRSVEMFFGPAYVGLSAELRGMTA